MRLTGKDKGYTLNGYYGIQTTDLKIAFNKLGQLEDIEDKLGIDLFTLFKALENGVFYRDQRDNGIHLGYPQLSGQHISIIGKELILRIKDYGKTWALTRGELE